MVINNGILLCYGKISSTVTLPISYTSYYSTATGNTLNRTDGNVATYNDISCYSGAIYDRTLSSFVCRGSGYFVCVGY